MSSQNDYEPNMLPQVLPIYYKRLFPFDQYYKWLSYGNVPNNYFSNREFSFTIDNDIYLRYQSFKDKQEMEKEIQRNCPFKIDIGAVYSFRPKDRKKVQILTPLEKELVFDIDMTDYDEVRYCCSGADICHKCWTFMTVAIQVLDSALREDFGFKHILWVYSGRRGVHCWVCDASARSLSQSARSAVAEYLQVVRGGEFTSKKVTFPGSTLHPLISRSLDIISRHFEQLCIEDQDFLADKERWTKVLDMIRDNELRENLAKLMPKCSDTSQRWRTIVSECMSSRFKRNNVHTISEIKAQLVYPRLDINVSKGLNHLLKSPFSIHPKTGRVCVPIDPKYVLDFDPMTVPTLTKLISELNEFDADKMDVENDNNVQNDVNTAQNGINSAQNNDNSAQKSINLVQIEYKKTSMKNSVLYFEKFLAKLGKENAERRLELNDMKFEF